MGQEASLNIKTRNLGVPFVVTVETNPTSNHKDGDLIPGLGQWVKDPVLP